MYAPTFDSRKFRDLILYLSHLSADDRFFGATKLCKLLYYCDFMYFWRHLTPITGASYVKQPRGPAPTQFFAARDALVEDEEAVLKFERILNLTQQRLVPVGDCSHKAAAFSEDELEVIHKVCDELDGMTASQEFDLSHSEPGWVLTDYYKVIPYESAFIYLPDEEEFGHSWRVVGISQETRLITSR